MDSVLELLYSIIKECLPSNPYYERAQARWDALEPTLPLEAADAAFMLKEEWGFSCFAAGLAFRQQLEKELKEL